MAPITAVGPRLNLDGPPPVAPPNSLLNTPGVVVDAENHVFTGVNLLGYPDSTPSVWNICEEEGSGGMSTKDEGGAQPTATFDAFACYLPVTCSSITYGGMSESELLDFARPVLEATYSMAIERALAQGVFGSANPYFGDANMAAPNGNSAVKAEVALAFLEQAIGETGRTGMIHGTPAMLSRLQPWAMDVAAEEPLTTINGNKLVSGDGYIGVDPDSQTGPSTGKSWAFATGPVEVRLGPIFVTNLAESLDRSDNTITFRAERLVLAYWDTALQAGVLVDWTA